MNERMFLAIACGVIGLLVSRALTTSMPRTTAEQRALVFSGESRHEFGHVDYRNRLVELHHVFGLRNERNHKVTISEVKASCGCTIADVEPREIGPGESVSVPVTLRLTGPGPREEKIWLNLGVDGLHTLTVSAVGKIRNAAYAVQRAVPLHLVDQSGIMISVIDADRDNPPAYPAITAPEAVEFEFLGWRQIVQHHADAGRSARWIGVIRVSRIGGSLPLRSKLHVMVGESKIAVDLTGWPW